MEMANALAAMAALAQETRLSVYRLLMQTGPAGMAAGEIGELLGVPPATLSFHLNHLRQANLIVMRRQGRSLIYAADFAAMNGLLAYLSENCCQGAAPADAAACGCRVTPVLACEPVAEDA